MRGIYDLVMWASCAARWRRPPDPARYILAQPGWLPPGGTVLDFGGGDGRWALPLAEARGARVAVADVDEAALRRVPRHPRLGAALLDGRALPFGGGVSTWSSSITSSITSRAFRPSSGSSGASPGRAPACGPAAPPLRHQRHAPGGSRRPGEGNGGDNSSEIGPSWTLMPGRPVPPPGTLIA